MYERDRLRRNDGEMDFRDTRGGRGAGTPDDMASDDDGSAPRYNGAAMDDGQELPPDDSRASWSHRAGTDAYADEDEGASPGYPRSAPSARPANRFLDDPASDFDDPSPAKPGGIGAAWFFLLMALIGVSAGGLWFYFDPDLARYVPGLSNARADKTTEILIHMVDEQAKLTQSVTAMQAAQDALQKNIAGREQEIQRLLAETQALRSDVNALRTDLAESAVRPRGGQGAKGAPAAAKKAKAERKSAPQPEQPANETPPTALAPPQ
jgi:cell division protein FtsB